MQGWRLVVFCAESDTDSDISWQVNDHNAGRPELLRHLELVSNAAVPYCTSSYTLLSAIELPERLPLPPKPFKLARCGKLVCNLRWHSRLIFVLLDVLNRPPRASNADNSDSDPYNNSFLPAPDPECKACLSAGHQAAQSQLLKGWLSKGVLTKVWLALQA